MSATGDLLHRVEILLRDLVEAMGLSVTVSVSEAPDHIRIALDGEDGEWLVRRKGEGLEALQHIVNAVFRRDVDKGRRLVVDSLDFRKARDRELRQMTRFLIERARQTGLPQEIGPLNSYSRRLVHLEVAGQVGVVSESLGEGAVKRVVISVKRELDGSA
jgi:spoIIIJ-associated protein